MTRSEPACAASFAAMGCAPTKEAGVPSASPGDVSVEAAPEARPQLSAARLQRVQALFAEWDVGGAGRFEIAGFEKQSTMKVGPHESQLLARLGDMDVDGDGYITKEEWQDYFGSAVGDERAV